MIKKLLFFFLMIFMSVNMMGVTVEMMYIGSTTTNMAGDNANNATMVNLDADLFTVLANKGGNTNLPGLNKDGTIRLYADKNTGNGNSITVNITNGTIDTITLDIKQTTDFVVKSGETIVTETDGIYIINSTSFTIQNTTVGDKTQLHFNKITIDYETEPITTDIANIKHNPDGRKIVHNGQIFIIKNGKTFNILGQRLD